MWPRLLTHVSTTMTPAPWGLHEGWAHTSTMTLSIQNCELNQPLYNVTLVQVFQYSNEQDKHQNRPAAVSHPSVQIQFKARKKASFTCECSWQHRINTKLTLLNLDLNTYPFDHLDKQRKSIHKAYLLCSDKPWSFRSGFLWDIFSMKLVYNTKESSNSIQCQYLGSSFQRT